MIKGGNGGAKNNLEGGAKSSDGAVAAFDLEAFVKVKFSELEKTARQLEEGEPNVAFTVHYSIPCFRTCLLRAQNVALPELPHWHLIRHQIGIVPDLPVLWQTPS